MVPDGNTYRWGMTIQIMTMFVYPPVFFFGETVIKNNKNS
jgi:hypothetical protein